MFIPDPGSATLKSRVVDPHLTRFWIQLFRLKPHPEKVFHIRITKKIMDLPSPYATRQRCGKWQGSQLRGVLHSSP